MSTEDKLSEIFNRVRTGLTTYKDSDYLESYFKTLNALVLDYANQLREARDKIELLEYYQNCNE